MSLVWRGRLAGLARLLTLLAALAAAPAFAQMPGEVPGGGGQMPGGSPGNAGQMPGEPPGGAGQVPGGPLVPADPGVVTIPPQGSPERAAILNGLRPMVIAEVGAPVEFVVGTIRVVGEWAFVEARPQRPGGGEIFYIYTRYQAAVDAGAFDDSVIALLRQTPAGWLVYEYVLGATDVAWIEWIDRNLAPSEVYPFQP
ncbi:MAG: hypothetical protein IT535_09220 [Bauldia sp.]|nr:hypothetical protein [Bauldia sp.]